MKLDCSPLKNAVDQLQKSLDYLHSEMARNDSGLREQFRTATIKAFEYSYELAVAMIRKQLVHVVATPAELHRVDFAELMRRAADAGIIPDAIPYIHYRDLRNNTVHAYNVDQAEKTVAEMGGFLQDLRFLISELERRNPESD